MTEWENVMEGNCEGERKENMGCSYGTGDTQGEWRKNVSEAEDWIEQGESEI